VKLASFHAGGRDRVGLAVSDTELAELDVRDMLEIIEGRPVVPTRNIFPLKDIRWLPPVRRPTKMSASR
jgi:hypothetical protein